MENLTKEAGRGIQDLRERGSRRGTLFEVSPPPLWWGRGSGGILHRKMFEIETLQNGISGILRLNERVIMSYFFVI